ncbi:oxidoreductase [Verrucomicrobiota bacterium]|nr:oxidoreductase [Verrucomicrobiota bacterium]
MKQVLIKKGQVLVDDIAAPVTEPGTVLVRVDHSCISIGTEMSGIKASSLPLWKRALQQPEKVKKALKMISTQGLSATKTLVEGKLDEAQPTGYSAAGTVLEVGDGITDLAVGDRVACAGAQCAHHAEVIRVPRNLTVLLPDELGFAEASTVTLGAIAMQGVRRAQPTLGETFVVIGLGILGQLASQLLRANGCRVIGTDLDRGRIRIAQELGQHIGIHPDDGSDVEQVARLTDGAGADGVIITAATPSDAVISTAFKMCRKKGRVVLVGDVGLNLNRADFYAKELDFFISCSYGPGRYDANYEERGLDYPLSYVRWTENRNMGEYLRLVAEGRINLKPLIGAVFPVAQTTEAYAAVRQGSVKAPLVLLSYPPPAVAGPEVRAVRNVQARPAGKGLVRIALVGAGNFAKAMHLPNLRNLPEHFHLQAVMSRTGHSAANLAKQFGANYSTTEFSEVLRDPEVDAVLISTRHNLHASMCLQALQAGKHVLVEKPLALTQADLLAVEGFYHSVGVGVKAPVLLTGFNRRFSPAAQRLKQIVAGRTNPMILNYRMNAGYIPLDSWVHTAEGGGRNMGEACHIYDLFTFLTGAKVVEVTAQAIKPAGAYYTHTDNFVTNLRFDDGSVGSLTYTALGSKEYPKEKLDVYVDGKVLVLDDYLELTVTGARQKGVSSRLQQKGHSEELKAFAQCIRQGGDWPIPLWEQIQATDISFQVEKFLRR